MRPSAPSLPRGQQQHLHFLDIVAMTTRQQLPVSTSMELWVEMVVVVVHHDHHDVTLESMTPVVAAGYSKRALLLGQ
jgi:hypothetical protein